MEDSAGNRTPDSTISIIIPKPKALPKEAEFGDISGKVFFDDSAPIVIILKSATRRVSQMTLASSGVFKFENIPAGYYDFEAFFDKDHNGRYDYGLWKPFRFPERFTIIEDSFRVRSRWETSGVEIRLE
jgi:hypothetical protein